MFCVKCGQKLSEDVVFCEKCGTKIGGNLCANIPQNCVNITPTQTINSDSKRKSAWMYVGIVIAAIILICILADSYGYPTSESEVTETIAPVVTNIFNKNAYDVFKALNLSASRAGRRSYLGGGQYKCTKITKIKEIDEDKYSAKAFIESTSWGKFIVDITYEFIEEQVQVHINFKSAIFI